MFPSGGRQRWHSGGTIKRHSAHMPYEFTGFWAGDVLKPFRFIWFGDIHGPRPNQITKFRWAFIAQTPVRNRVSPEKPRSAKSRRPMDVVTTHVAAS